MMSRLIFNLRQRASAGSDNFETTFIPISVLRFAGRANRRAPTTLLNDTDATHSTTQDIFTNADAQRDDPSKTHLSEDIEMIPIAG